jgi:Pyruvate/2-oxoacid:ferredoxin oxidoreductase gamma subunit
MRRERVGEGGLERFRSMAASGFIWKTLSNPEEIESCEEANIKNKTINGPIYGRNLVRVNDADYRIPPAFSN